MCRSAGDAGARPVLASPSFMNICSQDYWDASYATCDLNIANDAITRWLDGYLPATTGDAFEAGCYPGRYLAHLGKRGWRVSGVDMTPQTTERLPAWLSSIPVDTKVIVQADAIDYMRTTSDRYDLVCSFGFIEHFQIYEDVLSLHARIVAPGGMVVISAPNFRGAIQHLLHSWLDHENLARHHLPAMSPLTWRHILAASGLTTLWAGYFGNFDFWVDAQKRSIVQRIAVQAITTAQSGLRWLPSNGLYSPYCGLVAMKPTLYGR